MAVLPFGGEAAASAAAGEAAAKANAAALFLALSSSAVENLACRRAQFDILAKGLGWLAVRQDIFLRAKELRQGLRRDCLWEVRIWCGLNLVLCWWSYMWTSCIVLAANETKQMD